MTVRAKIIVSGNVQGVGYRTLVKQIANQIRITGIIRNLEGGQVEIYCQGVDNTVIEEFIKRISVKNKNNDVFTVNTESKQLIYESDNGFGNPKTDFKRFEIDYGIDVDNFQKESLERSEIGILLLSGARTDIQSMHGDMNTRFDTLDTKYGEISKKMNELTSELHRSTDALIAMTEKVGAIIDKKLAE